MSLSDYIIWVSWLASRAQIEAGLKRWLSSFLLATDRLDPRWSRTCSAAAASSSREPEFPLCACCPQIRFQTLYVWRFFFYCTFLKCRLHRRLCYFDALWIPFWLDVWSLEADFDFGLSVDQTLARSLLTLIITPAVPNKGCCVHALKNTHSPKCEIQHVGWKKASFLMSTGVNGATDAFSPRKMGKLTLISGPFELNTSHNSINTSVFWDVESCLESGMYSLWSLVLPKPKCWENEHFCDWSQ